jgi:hypothetical protein
VLQYCYANEREEETAIKLNEKRATLITAALFSATYILAFLLRFLTVYAVDSQLLYYVSFYFFEVTTAVMPLLASVSAVMTYAERGLNPTLLRLLLLVLTGLLYYAPICAIDYALLGEDAGYVILITLIESLFALVLNYLKYTVIFLVILFISRKIATAKGCCDYSYRDGIRNSSPFDFSEPISFAFFSGALILFVYSLVFEIIDTVKFIIEYNGIYRIGEILYIIFRYIFILAMLFISQITAFAYKKFLITSKQKV